MFQWEKMTLDEYAKFKQTYGINTLGKDGVWWLEAKPCFYRPLLPWKKIIPHSVNYPAKSLLGGVQHAVPPGMQSNSTFNLFFFKRLQDYTLQGMSKSHRRHIKKGMANFTLKPMTDLDEFIDQAHKVYLSFHARTKYSFKNERLNKNIFAKWSQALFSNPKILILGAWQGNQLAAIDISYRIDDVIVDATFFSDTPSLSLGISDYILHYIREMAATSDAACIFLGWSTGERGLDDFKIQRGCILDKIPAYYQMNPLIHCAAKILLKNKFKKLLGNT